MWKPDRLDRSTKDILILADSLYDRGVQLRILTGNATGTYSPTGEAKLVFTVMAAFAELPDQRGALPRRCRHRSAVDLSRGPTGRR